jgi:putative lipoic acid-binding regulatory protein
MTQEESDRFRQKLSETMSFPSVYMYKFIIESGNRNIALVENLFDEDTEILTKESKAGKYISITAKQVVMNVDEIIAIYQKAAKIEGIMFL